MAPLRLDTAGFAFHFLSSSHAQLDLNPVNKILPTRIVFFSMQFNFLLIFFRACGPSLIENLRARKN